MMRIEFYSKVGCLLFFFGRMKTVFAQISQAQAVLMKNRIIVFRIYKRWRVFRNRLCNWVIFVRKDTVVVWGNFFDNII